MAMKKQDIVEMLTKEVCTVVFTKADGSKRTMKCTLKDGIVPAYEKKTDLKKPVNDNVLPVYDVDNEGFRSFRVDSVESIVVG